MIRKLLYSIILLSADKISMIDRLQYWAKAVMTLGAVAGILDFFGKWFSNNEVFYQGMLFAITGNMIIGWRWHYKLGDFKWSIFWTKNIQMWFIIIMTYPVLHIVSSLAGDNPISETFKIVIQISTFLYPGSKIMKNAYLLSEKRYPPQFIMERLYRFEKTGDIKELLKEENDLKQE